MASKYRDMTERIMANSYVDDTTGCWLWAGRRDRGGYAVMNMRVDGAHKSVRVHRLVMRELVGLKLRVNQLVNHLCCVRHCVNPAHLETTGHKGNARYREKMRRK